MKSTKFKIPKLPKEGGYNLLTVMTAVALLGILSIGISRFMENQHLNNKILDAKKELSTIKHRILSQISCDELRKQNCGTSAPINVNLIRKNKTRKVFAGDKYAKWNIRSVCQNEKFSFTAQQDKTDEYLDKYPALKKYYSSASNPKRIRLFRKGTEPCAGSASQDCPGAMVCGTDSSGSPICSEPIACSAGGGGTSCTIQGCGAAPISFNIPQGPSGPTGAIGPAVTSEQVEVGQFGPLTTIQIMCFQNGPTICPASIALAACIKGAVCTESDPSCNVAMKTLQVRQCK